MSLVTREQFRQNPERALRMELERLFYNWPSNDLNDFISRRMKLSLPGIEERDSYEKSKALAQYVSMDCFMKNQEGKNASEICNYLTEEYHLDKDERLRTQIFNVSGLLK